MRPFTGLLFGALLGATACGDDGIVDEDSMDAELIVRGSASATAPAGITAKDIATNGARSASQLAVNPTTFTVRFSEMRISRNVDCTGPYSTIFTRATPVAQNLVASPEIARVSGVPAGAYPCVALRVSDIISFTPATTSGACVAGTLFSKDIYRAGNEPVPFLDINGATITATGTDTSPGEDIIWALFSTSVAAVTGRGYSSNQVNPLSAPLTVPGTTVFYWDAANSVFDRSGKCDIQPGAVGFR